MINIFVVFPDINYIVHWHFVNSSDMLYQILNWYELLYKLLKNIYNTFRLFKMNYIKKESQLQIFVPRAWSHPGVPGLRCSPSWSPSPGHSQPPLPPATRMRPQRGTGHGTSYPNIFLDIRYSIGIIVTLLRMLRFLLSLSKWFVIISSKFQILSCRFFADFLDFKCSLPLYNRWQSWLKS